MHKCNERLFADLLNSFSVNMEPQEYLHLFFNVMNCHILLDCLSGEQDLNRTKSTHKLFSKNVKLSVQLSIQYNWSCVCVLLYQVNCDSLLWPIFTCQVWQQSLVAEEEVRQSNIMSDKFSVWSNGHRTFTQVTAVNVQCESGRWGHSDLF